MHPNPLFRSEDRALFESLIDQVGFGMVFLTTPDGPRVAHTPLLSTGDGAVQFHLARGNALTRHLDGATALIVVNGPDSYVSPRWYADRAQVPTWDYLALELEGRVRRMDEDGVEALLHTLIERHENRIEGEPWRAEETPADRWDGLRRGIVGFELEAQAWRPTVKLSQKKSPEERDTIAAQLAAHGSPALAQLMRALVA
ncbi:FMN-binding negative transcriptional regulator [Erythrobacter sp. LQ02-29]|uniref:FMN-binding negative transcriptional regulator n=1 Tax=unclassified Erythrobacter TaxID=2633097 RepID=UPI001BFC8419|nr:MULTISPECIES: FMN-binding negative transcriptional regulator [unclassified Erythrobacter]MCP9222455.1 FMN-binding negative transcriptional regulator [Erythrobacter sp. LQ02-29]QWC56254.1 FMN-binding negative transcriptional regulator [Erythrobacter sp. 3-20A1M]